MMAFLRAWLKICDLKDGNHPSRIKLFCLKSIYSKTGFFSQGGHKASHYWAEKLSRILQFWMQHLLPRGWLLYKEMYIV